VSDRELVRRYLDLAEAQPDGDAVIFERAPFSRQRLTWADIANRSDDLMQSYRRDGVSSGSRCAVVLADSPDLVPSLLALWRLDATAVLVDPAWGRRLRTNVLAHSGASYEVDVGLSLYAKRIGAEAFRYPLPAGTAVLGYTSGSTGDPKAIPFTHSKLAWCMRHSAAVCAALRGGNAPKRIGYSARLSGSGVLNLNYMWAPFVGAAVVVLPELTVSSARDYWRHVESAGVEQTYLFPAHVELVNQLAQRVDLSMAPLCLTGSAPVSARLQRRFAQRFGIPLRNCYGIMEAMCIVFFGHLDQDGNATTSVGKPCVDLADWEAAPAALRSGTESAIVQTRIVGEQGEIITGPGVGELQLAGPTVLDYYYGNPEATAAAFDDPFGVPTWLRTGDIVRRDESFNFTVVGRRKHVVMRGGFSIYLTEVEEAAMSIPGVIEAAAIPIDLEGHEDIGLLVRLDADSPMAATDVQIRLCEEVGAQRAPYRVAISPTPLPRTGPEKLDRQAAAERWEGLTCLT
jgi:long-chain acyl-CoA synthetase